MLGLNATSDGRHVVMAAQAERLTEKFAAAGFEPVTVDVSELLEGPWRREVRDARAARAGGRENRWRRIALRRPHALRRFHSRKLSDSPMPRASAAW